MQHALSRSSIVLAAAASLAACSPRVATPDSAAARAPEASREPTTQRVRAEAPPPGVFVSAGSCPDVTPKLSETVSDDLRVELSEEEGEALRELFLRWIYDPSLIAPSERGLMRAHGHLDDGIGDEPGALPTSEVYCGEPAKVTARGLSDAFYDTLSGGEFGAPGEIQGLLNLRCDGNLCCSSSLSEYHVARGVIFEPSEDGWRVRAAHIASDDATLGSEFVERGYEETRERFASMMKRHACRPGGEPRPARLCESAGVFCYGPVGARESD
ncbi:hypothetical protein PPSIR1_10540 [Plesiocystis pacifica SIR-1]|uniref:Lipoprotein n=1 Tax=Plesiocystis pacifica SIR-1 TaxID=391625 RepID=A6G4U2_9BACT|nr:hypothetical protein [Plesiocystis pacifica]EDM79034.1 hypothetical protein PPSIR1_10540 [Plesiocystis pacifica SIR-1]